MGKIKDMLTIDTVDEIYQYVNSFNEIQKVKKKKKPYKPKKKPSRYIADIDCDKYHEEQDIKAMERAKK